MSWRDVVRRALPAPVDDGMVADRVAAQARLDAPWGPGEDGWKTDHPHRLEQRTRHTSDCPDEPHHHCWVVPQVTAPGRVAVSRIDYHADPRGRVEISEEALAELLEQAGYTPTEKP